MVQKYQSPVRVYKHPFELVMAAYERRFPTCPQMPIVLDCIITKDEILDNGARRNTSRRCKLAVDAPYLFKKIMGVDVVYFIQHNFLDLANRTLNIEAVNETFSSRIEIFERCRYYAHPDNPDWTCFDQLATLDIKNFFGFESSMEKMGMKQYTQTTLKGKEIIEYFINELKAEGITHIERWTPPIDKETGKPITMSDDTNENNEGTASVSNGGTNSNNIDVEGSNGGNGIVTGSGTDKLGENGRTKSISSAGPTSPLSPTKRFSFEDTDLTLDGDFIAKHLGQLSPMQESKLLQLHKLVKDSEGIDKCPNYQTILRFLRARDFNVEKAFHSLKDSIQWRQEYNVDRILKDYKIPSVIANHFPGSWHHHDTDGRPIYVLRLGHMDVKGLLKALGEDGLLKLTIRICEEGVGLIFDSSKRLEKPVLSWCLLVDLEGLSMRHLWRPGVKALLKIIETVEKHYPETMGRVLVVRAPRVFPIAWTIVSTFIDEHTRSKFLFHGGPDTLHMKDGLEQYLDPEIIPDFLDGPCKTLIHEGGLVPKSLYKMNSEEEANSGVPTNNGHPNLYQTVELRPSYIHEVVIKNNDPKSVLTWDFDVLRSDIHFTLYRTIKDLPPKTDCATSFFDMPGFEEGKNYFREEPSIICRHKESVQGSHVMGTTENYVLHWFSPPTSSSSEGPAQLNYFYEVLSSANYKGSMTSLQSGFSSTSATSSFQSR